MLRHRTILAWLLVALLTASCGRGANPRTTDLDGRHWVRLSDRESILPLLERHAERATCETVAVERWKSFGQIELVCERSCRAVKTATERGANIEQVCSYETISVMQLKDMLGFRCSSLPATPCERIVRSLSNGRPDALNALGGSAWGIRQR